MATTGGFDVHPENINKDGRPKGVTITGMVRQALEQVPDNDTRTYIEIITDIIIKKAIEGDTQMLKMVWQFIDGMPRQGVDIAPEGTAFRSIVISPSLLEQE